MDPVRTFAKLADSVRKSNTVRDPAVQALLDEIDRWAQESEISAPCPICGAAMERNDCGIPICVQCSNELAARAEQVAFTLSAIVDSSDDAIISKNLDGIITSWNKGAEKLFGYTPAEAIGQPVTLLMPPDRYDEEPQILARIRRGELIDHYETVRRRKDGLLIDISLTVSPVRNARGVVIGASKISRDMTAAKQADRGNRLLAAIIDSSDDAIISKDLNGIVTSWNRGAERLFGYTAGEMIGQSITLLIPPDRIEEEPQILARIRSGEPVDHFETVRRCKNGQLLDISLTISPIRDQRGVVIGASKIARDITERKKMDAAIRRANRDLEQFAFSASHDLQEPLRSINIYSELLAQRYAAKLDGDALKFLGYMQSGATRMAALVRDLLAYTHLIGAESTNEVTDANAALSTALDNLAGSIAESQAVIHSETLPCVPMHVQHLQQIFQNLIGNAIKYRSPGRPPEIRVASKVANGSYSFSVSDNGIGIDPKYQETIFEPFKRLHSGDQYAGTGIGLAICQRIVEQLGGRIWVESQLGKGSTFHFTIRSGDHPA
jgi:PAS domain S-box-containing protein